MLDSHRGELHKVYEMTYISQDEQQEQEDERKKGKFVIKNTLSFKDLLKKKVTELPESDLCFQNDDVITQWDYVEPEEKNTKIDVNPGVYLLTMTNRGVVPKNTTLHSKDLLEDIVNTTSIIREADTFFSRLHIYDQINRPKKRGILLYSDPGLGKTAAITSFCNRAVQEDPGTVVFVWPTSKIESDHISTFLSINSQFTKKCTRLLLVMEDIGGGEREGNHGSRQIDSGLLNLLDGLEVTFHLPTFIIATTNFPQNLLSALADRPGRFDRMIKLEPPTASERVQLVQFIAKRDLTEEEAEAVSDNKCNKFSIAHLEEIVVRSLLDDKKIGDVVDELIEHTERFKNDFNDDNKKVGFGGFCD